MNLLSLRDTELSLDQLVEHAGRLLAVAGRPADERVSAAPDARTLRYYQSLGLLDRPLRYDGRNAVYGYRHLLQALCVKLLQAQGFNLSQAQRALDGASTAALESAALEAVGGADTPAQSPPPAAPAHRPLLAVELAPGLGLWIDPARVPDPDRVIAALTSALTGLIPPFNPGEAP